MPYECLEELAVADIAFRAWGRTLEEVVAATGDATINVIVDNLDSIEFKESRPLQLANSALDMLLFDLLNELIYHKDTDQLLLRVREVRISQADGQWSLSGKARGENLDPARHQQRADVKAVTLHQFNLEQTEQGWSAQVILDI